MARYSQYVEIHLSFQSRMIYRLYFDCQNVPAILVSNKCHFACNCNAKWQVRDRVRRYWSNTLILADNLPRRTFDFQREINWSSCDEFFVISGQKNYRCPLDG